MKFISLVFWWKKMPFQWKVCLLRLTSCWILDFSFDDRTGMVAPMHYRWRRRWQRSSSTSSGVGDVLVLVPARTVCFCLLAPGAFNFLTHSSSLFSVYFLTGVAALLAQGTCPPLSDPIFDLASLML